MAELVANCPRCRAINITFDVTSENFLYQRHHWQNWYEIFSQCRHCHRSTVFVVSESVNGNYKLIHETGLLKVPGSLNSYVEIHSHVSPKDNLTVAPPEHLPEDIKAIFSEASICIAVGCFNAAGTMFRLCLDMATRGMLPEADTHGLNARTRRDLGLRLPWLFDNGLLPEALRELSACIKEDGNDGAHAGTLQAADAGDLLDFTGVLLERIYTEPARLREAQSRRDARRADK